MTEDSDQDSCIVASFDRLKSYYREAGLAEGGGAEEQLRHLKGAIPAVLDWLDDAEDEPVRIVMAVQLLMLNPQRPAAHNFPEVRAISKVLEEDWLSAGDRLDHVQLFQMLVMAVWPGLGCDSWLGLPQLLRKNFGACPMPKLQAGWRQTWWENVHIYHATRSFRDIVVKFPLASKPPHESKTAKDALKLLESPPNDNVDRHGRSQVSPATLQSTKTIALESKKSIAALWKSVRKGARLPQTAPPIETELLWWGQARYSESLARPFREVNEDTRLAFAALEVSEYSPELPFNPLASYLVETLHALGDRWDEERNLTEWLSALSKVTASLADHIIIDADKFAATSTTGLPVLSLLTGSPRDGIGEQCRIDVDTKLTRADWATWVLGELILARMVFPHAVD